MLLQWQHSAITADPAPTIDRQQRAQKSHLGRGVVEVHDPEYADLGPGTGYNRP